MTRARELANFADDTAGLESLTVSDITDLSVSASNINSATNQITDSSTDLNVDSNTLVVDKSANSVGIGDTNPNQKLEINGDVRISDGRSLFFKRIGDNYAFRIRNESAAGTDPYSTGWDGSNKLVFEVVSNSNSQANPGDSSHSIYSSSVNQLVLKENGNLGIGVDPQAKLHLSTADNTVAVKITQVGNESYGIGVFSGSGSMDYLSLGMSNMVGTASSRFFNIQEDGNVGIGSTSPSQKLSIASQVGFPSAGSAPTGGLGVLSNNKTYGVYIGVDPGSADGHIQAMRTDSATYQDLCLQPSGGNVGIGTSSPYKTVTLSKNIGGTQADLLDIQSSVAGGGTQPMIRFGTWASNSNTIGRIGFVDIPNYGGGFVVETNSTGSPTDSTTEKFRVDKDGHTTPGADNAQDLGTSSKRWRNIYTADLQLSNVNTGGNDVDGTEGSWTLQEGAEDLYIINRQTGKKFKFNLIEV